MRTKYSTLMLSRYHLSAMDHLPAKAYKAIISGLLHYYYDDETPDFSSYQHPEQLKTIFNRMVGFIENGLTDKAV